MLKGSALTFGPKCVSHKTSDEQFLSGTIHRVPSAKRHKLAKHFDRQYQTFINVTVPGNLHGTHKNNSLLDHFRIILTAIIDQESRLVILP